MVRHKFKHKKGYVSTKITDDEENKYSEHCALTIGSGTYQQWNVDPIHKLGAEPSKILDEWLFGSLGQLG